MTEPTNEINGFALAAEIFTAMEAPFPEPVTISLVEGSSDILIEFDPPREFCLAVKDDRRINDIEFAPEMLKADIIAKLIMGSSFEARINGRLITLQKVRRTKFGAAKNWRDAVGRDNLV